jgi:ClpP class serine protease
MGPMMQRASYYCGWIDGYDSITERVLDALSDREVGGIVLRIDSPGGDVAGIEECVRTIQQARDASGKPIAVYVDELAASGGYWLAASLSNAGVYAPRAGQVGSIGAYCVFADQREALKQEGIAVQLVREPPGKDAANPYDPVTDLAIARYATLVKADAERFYSAMAVARGKTPDEIRALNADVLGADEALSAGLIDGIKTFEEVIALINERSVSAVARRSEKTRGKAMTKARKAAEGDMPTEGAPEEKTRTTGADVATQARACSDACLACADACESGTADEAIDATKACIEACKLTIDTCNSFLGMSEGESEMPSEPPPPPETVATISFLRKETGKASLSEAMEEISRWKATQINADAERAKIEKEKAALEAEERRSLVAQMVVLGRENPATAWEDDSGKVPAEPWASMPMASLRARVAKMKTTPKSKDAPIVSGGLTERELRICKETGCDPEWFAAQKAKRGES